MYSYDQQQDYLASKSKLAVYAGNTTYYTLFFNVLKQKQVCQRRSSFQQKKFIEDQAHNFFKILSLGVLTYNVSILNPLSELPFVEIDTFKLVKY